MRAQMRARPHHRPSPNQDARWTLVQVLRARVRADGRLRTTADALNPRRRRCRRPARPPRTPQTCPSPRAVCAGHGGGATPNWKLKLYEGNAGLPYECSVSHAEHKHRPWKDRATRLIAFCSATSGHYLLIAGNRSSSARPGGHKRWG